MWGDYVVWYKVLGGSLSCKNEGKTAGFESVLVLPYLDS